MAMISGYNNDRAEKQEEGMKRQARWMMVAAGVLTVACLGAQAADTSHVEPLVPGRQVHAQAVLDTVFDFTLYAPAAYGTDITKRWPLIIQFPPVGATMPQAIGYGPGFGQLITVGICQRLNNPSTCKNVSDRFIVVSPYLKETAFTSQCVLVKNWIKYLFKTYRIDSTCVSYYGTCWGGNFGYSFSTAYPEIPSAAVLFDINGKNSPGGTLDLTKACTVKNIPIKVYSASGDVYANWHDAQAVVNRIDSCSGGGKTEFILLNSTVHEIYNFVDTTTALYDWMLASRKNPTAVMPGYIDHGKSKSSLDLNVKLSYHDHMDIIDVNGRLLYKVRGTGLSAIREIPKMNRGMYLVRITIKNESFARIYLAK
jgi:hypothetical protein